MFLKLPEVIFNVSTCTFLAVTKEMFLSLLKMKELRFLDLSIPISIKLHRPCERRCVTLELRGFLSEQMKDYWPTTVGSRSTNRALGTCRPKLPVLKNVLKGSSREFGSVGPSRKTPSGPTPCSRQSSSQQAFPVWTPAWPTWMEMHSLCEDSRVLSVKKADCCFSFRYSLLQGLLHLKRFKVLWLNDLPFLMQPGVKPAALGLQDCTTNRQ